VTLDELSFIIMIFADDMVILEKMLWIYKMALTCCMITVRHGGLLVTPIKVKLLFFVNVDLYSNQRSGYNNVPLQTVDNFNYLGVVFQTTIACKVLKTLNTLLVNIRVFVLKPSTTGQLFDSFDDSVLCYGYSVSGFNKNKEIERTHLQIL